MAITIHRLQGGTQFDAFGLSSDTKPTGSAGCRFVETDTGRLFVHDGTAFRPSAGRAKEIAFGRAAVAASLTDSQLGASVAVLLTSYHAPRAGSIVGLNTSLSIVGAGAALTVKGFKNGSAVATLTHDIAIAAQKNYTAFLPGVLTYAAGDLLDIRITTPVGWTAVTAAILSLLEVLD
jgi:hypothetical protein